MKPLTVLLLFCSLIATGVRGGEVALQSGPMVGYSEMREVLVWVQTTGPAPVQMQYREQGQDEPVYRTPAVIPEAETAFAVKLIADRVEPGRVYDYTILIDDQAIEVPYPLRFQTLPLWQWRTDPPAFRFAVGSCAYVNEPRYDRPGDPYGGDYQIFGHILDQTPDFMLWLGDNVYLREVDWNSRAGVFKRYTHTRSLQELQPLLGSVHHYALWDDHDYGPNNSDRGFWNKETTLEAFEAFWGNPSFGVPGHPGITTTFEWGDVQVFMLDNRYYRSPNRRETGERTILGAHQIQWLIDNLVSSRATFKVIAIGGQVLNPAAGSENYSRFPQERARLLQRIGEEDISGVVFLSGDRHRTELSVMRRSYDYPLYELTVSPLTAGAYDGLDEPNTFRLPDTHVPERNFAVIDVTGPRKERVLTMTVIDADGETQWSRTLRAQDLE